METPLYFCKTFFNRFVVSTHILFQNVLESFCACWIVGKIQLLRYHTTLKSFRGHTIVQGFTENDLKCFGIILFYYYHGFQCYTIILQCWKILLENHHGFAKFPTTSVPFVPIVSPAAHNKGRKWPISSANGSQNIFIQADSRHS